MSLTPWEIPWLIGKVNNRCFTEASEVSARRSESYLRMNRLVREFATVRDPKSERKDRPAESRTNETKRPWDLWRAGLMDREGQNRTMSRPFYRQRNGGLRTWL